MVMWWFYPFFVVAIIYDVGRLRRENFHAVFFFLGGGVGEDCPVIVNMKTNF